MNSGKYYVDNSTADWRTHLDRSETFLVVSRKANICATLSFILFGLIGNILLISVFLNRKFRINSSNVYLLSLAVNNTLFLVIHLEETFKSFVDVFGDFGQDDVTTRYYYDYFYKLALKLNLTDNFSVACRSFNFLRYVLRFNSSYIILAFTFQRLSLLIFPSTEKKLNSKIIAWKTVITIAIVSLLFNSWVLILFKTQTQNDVKHCDVDMTWKDEYYILTLVYTLLIIVAPIFAITISLLFICVKIFSKKPLTSLFRKQSVVRFNFRSKKKNSNEPETFHEPLVQEKKLKLKSYFMDVNKVINRISNKTNNSIKITKVLVLIATLYAAFNIPYLIISFVFFYNILEQEMDSTGKNYLFGSVQIAEIFYGKVKIVLNLMF